MGSTDLWLRTVFVKSRDFFLQLPRPTAHRYFRGVVTTVIAFHLPAGATALRIARTVAMKRSANAFHFNAVRERSVAPTVRA